MLVQVSYHGGVGCRTTHKTDDSDAHVFTRVDIAHVLAWMEGVMPTPLYPHYIVCFISGPGHLRCVVSGLSVPLHGAPPSSLLTFTLPSYQGSSPQPATEQLQIVARDKYNQDQARPCRPVNRTSRYSTVPGEWPTLLKAPTRTALRISAN